MRRPDATPEEVDALDRRWEARLDPSGAAEASPDLDPGLLVALDRLYALDDTPGVDPAFVRRLEESLMAATNSPTPLAGTDRAEGMDQPRRYGRSARWGDISLGRPSFGAIVSAAALVLVVLAVGLLAVRLGDESGDDNSGVVATAGLQASPTAAECDSPPRTAAPPIAGTMPPSPIEATFVGPDGHLALAPSDVPSGPQATVDEMKGIAATLIELAACNTQKLEAAEANRGQDDQWDANERMLALFTDDYLRRHVDPNPETGLGPGTPAPEGYPWWGPYWRGAAWAPARDPIILKIVRLPGDRVGAVLVLDEIGTQNFVVFAKVGDRWLIEEVASINPVLDGAVPAGDAVGAEPEIAIVLSDIFYVPTQLGIPPDTDVALTIANVGQAPHTFNIDALGIHVEVEPGSYETITVNANPGLYPFYCRVPGHEAAGMVGTLVADGSYRLLGNSPSFTPTPPPAESTSGPMPRPTPDPELRRDEFFVGATVIVNSDNVNFRAEPNFEGDIIRQLSSGEEMTIVAGRIEGDGVFWYQVEDGDGEIGFVVAEFLSGIEEWPTPEVVG